MRQPSSGPLDTDFEFAPVSNLGDLFSRTFSLYFRHFQWVLLLAVVFCGPLIVVKNYLTSIWPPDSKLVKFWMDSSFLGLLFLFTAPILTYVILRHLREGKTPSLGDSLQWGLKCFPKNFGYHFITGLMTSVGFLLLVVPGVFVMLWYGLLSAVVGAEGPAGENPMERSKALVQGHMGLLLGGAVSVFVLNMAVALMWGLCIGLCVGLAVAILGIENPFVGYEHWIFNSINELLSVVISMDFGIMTLCCYLAWSREGASKESGARRLAAVVAVEAPPAADPTGLDATLPGKAPRAKAKPKARARVPRKKAAPKPRPRAKPKR